MKTLEQIQQDIQSLPAEAYPLLADFIQVLRKHYNVTAQQAEQPTESIYEKIKASGLIGYVSVESNLSTTYKEVLAQGWGQKYDHD